MNPVKCDRNKLFALVDLPNIGSAGAGDLVLLGYTHPQQLIGADPVKMYRDLCIKTQVKHDLCVLDVFISITRFLDGEPPASWWKFTEERKQILLKEAL